MPRTKRPVKKQERKTSEDDEALKRFNDLVTKEKSKIDAWKQRELLNLDIAYRILLESLKDHLDKPIGQLRNELNLKEVPCGKRTRNSSRAASHDDGYLTENSSQSSGGNAKKSHKIPTSSFRSTATARRSRSADASCRKPPSTAAKTSQRRRSRSVYRTPAYNKMGPTNYPAITPKVTPHTPLTVLRQPRVGEMVVSMSGSPVMVPTCYTMQQEEKANCNVLLKDGTMLSLQPNKLRMSQAYIPYSLMDNNVLNQLKTLKDNLDKVVQLGEKAIK